VPIRPYSPADWSRLCAIHDAARRDELASNGLLEAFLTLEQTAGSEGLFDGKVLVYESEGEVQGFVAFAGNELTWLYVAPTSYGRGIGRALLRRAIAACAGNVTTEVLVGNEPALNLYLSEGFRVLRRVDGKLTGNEIFAASGYVLQRASSEA
jgi:ribosomal protein S18 acetylase RimI-like enzyme